MRCSEGSGVSSGLRAVEEREMMRVWRAPRSGELVAALEVMRRVCLSFGVCCRDECCLSSRLNWVAVV